jgi:hypothetical protein
VEAALEGDDVGFATCVTCELDSGFDGFSTTADIILISKRNTREGRGGDKEKVRTEARK